MRFSAPLILSSLVLLIPTALALPATVFDQTLSGTGIGVALQGGADADTPGKTTYTKLSQPLDLLYALTSAIPQSAQSIVDIAAAALGLNVDQARDAIGYAGQVKAGTAK